jgi:hypothetical protein
MSHPRHRRTARPGDRHRRTGRTWLGLVTGAVVLPILGVVSLPLAASAQTVAAPGGPPTQLVITSAAFSAPVNTAATDAFIITLENASGSPTTSSAAIKIDLTSSSAGKRFAATAGGATETAAKLAANTQSVTVYYGDIDVGSPTITVSLTSPPSNAGLLEGNQTETMTGALTATTLSASPNPATYGTSDSLTATTTSGLGTPTGKVTFLDGTSTLCSKVTTRAGVATCAVPAFAVATHSLTADFTSATADYANSASNPLALVVNAAPTTTTLSASLSPGTFGSPVVLATQVTSSAGTPTGTVTFDVGSVPICTGVTLVSGSATCSTSSLVAGANSLTATFTSSSIDYAGSVSSPTSLTVAAAPTTTALSSSVSVGSSTFGSPVLLTTQVTSSAGTPTGTVTFDVGSVPICTGVALVSGSATCSTSSLVAGANSLSATFTSASADYAGSVSSPISLTVVPASTATALISSANPSPYGAPVVVTAQVTSSDPAPTGSVTFSLGSVDFCADVPLTSGSATCWTNSLPAGTYALLATFTSTTVNDLSSSSPALSQVIAPASTVTTVSSSDGGSSIWPSAPTETATVTATSGTQPGGTVAFFDNGTPVSGCGAVPFALNAPAQCAIGSPDPGTYAITATATPATGNDASSTSGVIDEVVQAASTTTTLSASPTTATYGQAVTLAATETTAPGTVTFVSGSTTLCANVNLSGGIATCLTSSLTLGVDTVTATTTSASIDYAGSTSLPLLEAVTPGVGISLVITSAAFTTPASNQATNAFTVTLEDSYGNQTTSAAPIHIALNGSSAGKRFSATAGGTLETFAILPAGATSVTVYYGDTMVGSPTISVSLTTPPSNAGLFMGSQTETIT